MVKVLIVDDSDTLRMELGSILKEMGLSVIEGSNGLDGFKKATENPDLDLIITDLNMPELDGLTLSKKVHETPELQKIPIIMLTTENTQEMKAHGKSVGVIAWIIKPFDPEKLKVGVSAVLQRFAKT